MNTKLTKLSVALMLLIVSILPALQGQIAPTAPASTADTKKETKKVTFEPAKEAPPSAAQPANEGEEVVRLSPFVVSSEDTQRYQASSTLAGTRVRTDLADVGSAITVVTEQFLEDTGSKDAQSLLVYTTNTETAGPRGNYTGTGDATVLNEDSLLARPNINTRVRGLAAADNTRDYFLTNIPWDRYNIGRIDMSRGANAILFGVGSPSGIFNASTNSAEFRDANKVEWTYGQYDSERGYLDINKVLLPNELAVRFETLRDNTYYRQEPAYKQDKRFYVAARYDPKFLNKHGIQTSLKVNFEKGSINSNNPRMLPPVDQITPWFTALNKGTYNAISSWGDVLAIGNKDYQPWLSGRGLYGGPLAIFPDPTSSQEQGPLINNGLTSYFGIGSNGKIDSGIGGLPSVRMIAISTYSQYSQQANLPFSKTLNPYSNTYITDPTIYNFYDHMIDGPTKHEWQDFDVVSADLSQTYWNNRLGLQAVWSLEHYSNGQLLTIDSGDPNARYAITVDVNQILPDGSSNPNVGRPMVVSRAAFGNANLSAERKASRYTAFADIKASDFLRESWLTKLLGRHVFTAAYTKDRQETDTRYGRRFQMDPSFTALTGTTTPNVQEVMVISYLGDSLLNATTAHGANIGSLQALQIPTAKFRYYDSHWVPPVNPSTAGYVNPSAPWTNTLTGAASTQSENPANYVGWTTSNSLGALVADYGDFNRMVTYARKNREEITSRVFVWQGFLFDGDIVPTWSVRRDNVKSYSATPPQYPDLTYNVLSPSYVLPSAPTSVISGTIHSFSMVVHTPKALRKRLWGNTDLAFTYNKSSNLQDLAGRVDIYGNPVPPPTGNTKEYGFMLSTWNNKLSCRVIHYDTTIKNDTGALGGTWVVGYMAYMAYESAKRFELGLSGDPKYGSANSGLNYTFQPAPGQSAADALVVQRQAVDAGLAQKAWAETLLAKWGFDSSKSADWLNPIYFDLTIPTGITATQSTQSKGMEYEINFQPTKYWSLTMNASHNTAKYTALAENFQAVVNYTNTFLNGPAGILPVYFYGSYGVHYGPGAPYSLKGYWTNNFYASYLLSLAKQNANLPEIRPWRFNLVTNYNLSKYIKGAYIGLGYRWEDKVAIGYPVFHDTTANVDTFDVAHPYWGPQEKHVDLWAGYERKLSHGINWRIQLNVRDVGRKAHLIPISTQPDGTVAGVRIAEGQYIQVTNTFRF